MRLRHNQVLAAPIELVWSNVTDLYRVGQCLPGARVTSVQGGDFVGVIRTTLGPLVLTFDGVGSVTHRDDTARRIAIAADGHQRRGPGRATLAVEVTLTAVTEDRTSAHMHTTLQVGGLPAQLGEGIAQRASDPLVERFLTGMGQEAPCDDEGPQDQPLDIGRDIVSGLLSSYGRSARALLGRR